MMTVGNDGLGVNQGVALVVYMRCLWDILNLIIINDQCAYLNTLRQAVINIVYFHCHHL